MNRPTPLALIGILAVPWASTGCQALLGIHPGDGSGPTGVAGYGGTGIVAALGEGGTSGTAGRGAGGGGGSTAGSSGAAGGMAGVTSTGAGGKPNTAGRGGSGGVSAAGGTSGAAGEEAGGRAAGGSAPGNGGAVEAGDAGGGADGGPSRPNACPSGTVLDCSGSAALNLLPDGQLTSFSSVEWNGASGTWCDAHGLAGRLMAYAGSSPSAGSSAVDPTTESLKLSFNVAAGGYAGAGLLFFSCVDASKFTSLQFKGTLTAGSLAGCSLSVLLQTQDQRPIANTYPSGGTCNPDGGTGCLKFPSVDLSAPTGTSRTYTEAFSAFSNPAHSSIPAATQIVGIQWQATSASQRTCTAEIRIDDVQFH